MSEPMKDHKTICTAIAPKGWVYGGFYKGYYFFQLATTEGYRVMECLEEDLTKENLQFMAKHNLTRIRKD